MTKVLGCNLVGFVAAGSILEIIIFLASIPPGSTTAPTPIESALGYTQFPGAVIFGLFASVFGHSLDNLPSLLATLMFWGAAIGAFLLQSTLIGGLLWLPVHAWTTLRGTART
jgi:hypothetical protein